MKHMKEEKCMSTDMKGEELIKMKKLLYILNVAPRVNSFSYASMIAAQKLGIEFHIAGNWSYASDEEKENDENKYDIKIHQIDFIRLPYHIGNIKAYIQLKKLMQKEKFDIIHCNTPIGGILGRIVGKQCNVNKIIYQAHGFHFYKGAPKLNWWLYYPVEKWLAHYTDVMITINKEDYELAKNKMNLRNNGNVYYVPGVGIDDSAINVDDVSFEEKRKQIGVTKNAIVLISVGELNKNKNNGIIISALKWCSNPNIHYILCGVGEMKERLKRQADELGLKENIHFLGYRDDILELYKISDCFVLPSYREGLSRSLMEAMVNGLPCIVSKIRGNTDLIKNGEGGYLCDIDDVFMYSENISNLASNIELRNEMGRKNMENIKKFNVETVVDEIKRIYISITNGN